jgi:putative acetyltransferase
MSEVKVRRASPEDRQMIRALVERAFEQPLESVLVEFLVDDGDAVLELVAERDGAIVGHVLFSRLTVEEDGVGFPAVALAPIGVEPSAQRQGIGTALVKEAHRLLQEDGELLSVVVGDPVYYNRFGYRRELAELFVSDYQGDALQAIQWGDAPLGGTLVYARAFGNL